MKKSITLMGMSGVGKTTLSCKLPRDKWFHYSGDYRISSYYLRDAISDFLKTEAMKSPLIANLLKTDSIYIGSNLSIDNLSPVSAYIGKLGSLEHGGLDMSTFLTRQRQHYKAEVSACYDIGYFKKRAKTLYNYDYFLHDAGGSICELNDENIISYIAKQTDFIYLSADDDLIKTITQRSIDYPKPIYYNERFLMQVLSQYKNEYHIDDVNNIIPDDFVRFVIPKLMKHRHSKYLIIAQRYGKVIDARTAFSIRDETDFLELIEQK